MAINAMMSRSGSSSPVSVNVVLLAVVWAKTRWAMAIHTGVALAP